MDIKQILSFIKIEHTLFSLPFILIGYVVAHQQFSEDLESASSWLNVDLLWIVIAAIGARGLAMTLNRIIDRNVDAANPRTASRHLASGTMSLQSAWMLAVVFLIMLLLGASMLNHVALKMAWLPVLVFVVYPYTKRFTYLCHLWLGLCLGLAPAAAWLAIAGDVHGWEAITGVSSPLAGLLWYPTILLISIGVSLWITAFDINYALMDINSDKENGIHSFPVRFGEQITTRMTLLLTLIWMLCFILANPTENSYFIYGVVFVASMNVYVALKRTQLKDFQTTLFRASMLTGWILLIPILLI
jgi:4-hydroxybenzoate polyprenyltransferase